MQDVPRFTDPATAQAMFRSLKEQADTRGIALRPPPELPVACCGRGCSGCVWEGFYAAASYWCEQALERLRGS